MSETEHEFPPMDAMGLAMGHLCRVLERREPGLLDEWVESLEDEALLSEIIRLRHPRDTEQVLESRRRALILARHIRITVLARRAAKRLRKKRAA